MIPPKAKTFFLVGFIGLAISLVLLVIVLTQEQSGKIVKETNNTFQSGNNTTNTNHSGDTIKSSLEAQTGTSFTGDDIALQVDHQLNILMPSWFYNEGFQQLSEKISQDYPVQVNYLLVDTLSDYKKILKGEKTIYTGVIDLYLLPSDWIQDFDLQKINLGEVLSPYFHYIFASYINQKEVSFVPYAIDPLVTYVASSTNLSAKQLHMSDIFSYMMLWKKDKQSSVPFLFGVGKNDIRLLEKNRESFPNYFSFMYHLIYQFKQGGDTAGFKTWMDINNSQLSYKRNYVNYKKLYTIVAKRDEHCALYPDICLMAYKFADIRFGFVSDQVIWQKYFPQTSRDIKDIKMYNFPLSTNIYKVRGWGFVVHNDSQNIESAKLFFKQYVRSSMSNSYPLRENNLSALNNIFDIQRLQNKYKHILQYETNFSMMYDSLDTQEDFTKNTHLLDVLQGEYKSDFFLKNLVWEW